MNPKNELKEAEIPQGSVPITIMSEKDAYISERIKSQPKTIDDIKLVTREERNGIHRLSLPEYFEEYSYDCTMGQSCFYHGWVKREVMYGLEVKMDRWEQSKRGKFIFRWLSQNKRAFDESLNVKGWLVVNRSYFPDAPKTLFSSNGGVENGDAILGFMYAEQAISMRQKPSKDSIDRVKSEEDKHENHPNFYKAKLDSEGADGDDFAPSDALQEGRDF